MENIYQATYEHPYHFSIGGILRNEKREICCHYFGDPALRANKKYNQFADFYILMRETIESGETPEQALHRGLMEEFGATAKVVTYVCSLLNHYPIRDRIVEKTTAYFVCDLISQNDLGRRENDPEGGSVIVWMKPAELIAKMKEQGVRLNNPTFDESMVVERSLQF